MNIVVYFLILIFIIILLNGNIEHFRQPNQNDEKLLTHCFTNNEIDYMKRYYNDTEIVEDNNAILYLTPKDKISNYAGIPINNCDWMSYVCVDKNNRGNGVGTTLIKKALQKSKARGFSNIALAVKKKNKVAQKLYNKFGFRKFNGAQFSNPDGDISDVYYLTFR